MRDRPQLQIDCVNLLIPGWARRPRRGGGASFVIGRAQPKLTLRMARVNEGDMPGAKASFEQYLKLAPTGQHAETAKGILASIK